MINNKDIFNKIAHIDEKLANIFRDTFIPIKKIYDQTKEKRVTVDDLEKAIKRSRKTGNFNLIPAEKEGPCKETCIVYCTDKWGRKYGFKKIVQNKLLDYWFNCKVKNKRTIIYTTAWDEVGFVENFKGKFDGYAQDKSVLVVLLAGRGISIQYLK